MSPASQDIFNWLLVWESVFSSFLSMGAGIVFFYFAYYIHVAHRLKELYATGIESKEETGTIEGNEGGGEKINQSSTLDDIGYLPPRLSEDYVRQQSIRKPLETRLSQRQQSLPVEHAPAKPVKEPSFYMKESASGGDRAPSAIKPGTQDTFYNPVLKDPSAREYEEVPGRGTEKSMVLADVMKMI